MDITSSDGEVFVLTNGIGNITSITAGGNVTAASLSALTVNNVLTPASVNLFASGPLAGISVDAQGDLQAVSMNNMHLQPVAIGGNVMAASVGNLTIVGTAGGDAWLTSYAGLLGTFSVGDDLVSVMSMGSNVANLSAADNIYAVVTWQDFGGSATLDAGGACGGTSGTDGDYDGCGNIWRVNVWSDLVGNITAENSIGVVRLDDHPVGGVTAGDLILGTISAPLIGLVREGDRTAFIELPKPLIASGDEVRAATVEAYAQLMSMQEDLQTARTELNAVAAATAGEVVKTSAEANTRLAEGGAEAAERLADLDRQAKLALIEAEAKARQRLDAARVTAEAGRRMAQEAGQTAQDKANRELNRLQREAEGFKKAADAEFVFLLDNAVKAELAQNLRYTTAMDILNGLYASRSQVFVGIFLDKVGEMLLDHTQEQLEKISVVGDFVPGIGWAIAGVADLINSGISFWRGDKWGGWGSLVGVIPFAGTLLKKGVIAAEPGVKAARSGRKGVGSRFLTAAGESIRFLVCHDDFERPRAGSCIMCLTARLGA